jgi:hypothetical protein
MTMKRTVMFALLVTGVLYADGPVGQYLGYQLGRQAATSGWSKDSLQVIFPTSMDSVVASNWVDTATVEAESLYQGLPDYVTGHETWINGSLVPSYDTSYETAAEYLEQQETVADTTVRVTAYRIPFTVDSSWRYGIAGTYYVHPDTLNVDTIKIWGDTSEVIDQESVVTPYDTVGNCYKLRTTSHWRVTGMLDTFQTRDTLNVTSFEWYKDSLWAVKDSSFAVGKYYVYVKQLHMWFHAANSVSESVSQLVALSPPTGVAERSRPAAPSIQPRISICPNPFRASLQIAIPGLPASGPCSRVAVYDASGRIVFTSRFNGRLVWQPQNLPVGVYQIVVTNPAGEHRCAQAVRAPRC